MRHVYIHVPFCRRRCVYCDFAIAVRRAIPHDAFVGAIRDELALRTDARGEQGAAPATLYLGGGTPSLLDAGALAALVETVAPAHDAEVTLEANPDDVSPDTARGWIAAGVTRVSLGVQSFDDRVLQWMHRTHSGEDAVRAVRVLRDAGIANLSVDLIFGLPSELEREWAADLDMVLACEPEHLSVYGLTVEARTPLERWMGRGAVGRIADEAFTAEYHEAHRRLSTAGFDHYEVSNYARPGRRAVHNAGYWQGAPYVGLGPSAHSFDGDARRWNEREWAQYQRQVESGRDPVAGAERLSDADRDTEAVFLALRTVEGMPWPARETHPAWLDAAVDEGWVRLGPDRLQLTPSGWLRMDELIPRLTTSREGG